MVHVLVRHKVAEFAIAGKKHSTRILSPRKRAGEIGFHVFHSVEDPRDIFLLFDWESADAAQKFMTSGELRAADAASRRTRRTLRFSTWKMRARFIARPPIEVQQLLHENSQDLLTACGVAAVEVRVRNYVLSLLRLKQLNSADDWLKRQYRQWFRDDSACCQEVLRNNFGNVVTNAFWTALTNHSGKLKYPTTLRIDLQT